MKRLLNEASAFREEMIAGYAGAYGRYLQRVPDASGVMANGAPAPGHVSVVVGGGSGHYPAFYGLVGQGLAAAAAIGDIFTSPPGEQCYRVAKAVDAGAGILFTFGNYSGDVMNFGMAEGRLRAEGIDARTVLVTDDVLSASPEEADRRRGIAGGFFVFKSAGASAARGDSLDDVEALARHTNSRVRTAGIAFAGCTVPGQEQPLFSVAPGQMEIGLGIHGEPVVRVAEQMPSRQIAAMLVETLLAETPRDAGSNVAVLINGLGGTKYEEMFVFYNDVAALLDRSGLSPYNPLIGEFVTSLDMTGMSLSLLWLDDDLKPLLDATASSPAFTSIGPDVARAPAIPAHPTPARTASREVVATSQVDADPGGKFGECARSALRHALTTIEEMESELGRLDAAAGDGDHGAGMVRGLRAAVEAIEDFDGTARETFRRGGIAFQNAAGGASGALVGAWLIAIGTAFPDRDEAVDAAAVALALDQALSTLQRLGQAQPGDKTMVDTLAPFSAALNDAAARGLELSDAWAAALPAGAAGMLSTIDMVSRRGRASRLGERSRGVQDAGATSIYHVLHAFGTGFKD
ncbi:MAG TPA: dihydroxyacetone kinase subunit DhaL [Thermomicrobiales bacterium]|nr:dihydroxyacetone kinase subunit DhaL [Thermomicrobiales bacterium]